MEELLLKDNENVPLPIGLTDDLEANAGPQPFAPSQMVACRDCLRANPPTRLNCIYCGVALPHNETTADLQKPTLRKLEKWELGYNNILRAPAANEVKVNVNLAEAATLLRLEPADFERIISLQAPLPVARASSLAEAELVERRLQSLGLPTRIVSDEDLGVTESGPARVRALDLDEFTLSVYHGSDQLPVEIEWGNVLLVVMGRLITMRVEMKEQNAKRTENRILDSSEFFSDEVVCEFYARNEPTAFRISANSFDFSCLMERKALVSGENMTTLVDVFRERAPEAEFDNSYASMRRALDSVWPTEQQMASGGWRRERPGKYSIGSVMEKTNDIQFSRYSLLRHYLHRETRAKA